MKNKKIINTNVEYFQVVFDERKRGIQEVTAALTSLENAKMALEANKQHFPDENLYIIAKVNLI